jgi:hypothetical protein
MKLADSLRNVGRALGMRLEQILRLVFEVVEVGIGGKGMDRHGELPFYAPEVRIDGQKVSS